MPHFQLSFFLIHQKCLLSCKMVFWITLHAFGGWKTCYVLIDQLLNATEWTTGYEFFLLRSKSISVRFICCCKSWSIVKSHLLFILSHYDWLLLVSFGALCLLFLSQAAVIKQLASLNRDDLRKICGDSFPEWISFPVFEQVVFYIFYCFYLYFRLENDQNILFCSFLFPLFAVA